MTAAVPAWLRATADGVELAIYVQPGARKTEIVGEHDGALKLRVQAPPVEGKANAAVLAFIAARCEVARQRVTLVAGAQQRYKRVAVAGVEIGFVLRQMAAASG